MDAFFKGPDLRSSRSAMISASSLASVLPHADCCRIFRHTHASRNAIATFGAFFSISSKTRRSLQQTIAPGYSKQAAHD